ncbi:MAG: hypothetical protein HY815_32675 [Candidatus Riflebacteria bacterium]|nr:hypothetical protein [Candidatus Riflebacteria bacterium]
MAHLGLKAAYVGCCFLDPKSGVLLLGADGAEALGYPRVARPLRVIGVAVSFRHLAAAGLRRIAGLGTADAAAITEQVSGLAGSTPVLRIATPGETVTQLNVRLAQLSAEARTEHSLVELADGQLAIVRGSATEGCATGSGSVRRVLTVGRGTLAAAEALVLVERAALEAAQSVSGLARQPQMAAAVVSVQTGKTYVGFSANGARNGLVETLAESSAQRQLVALKREVEAAKSALPDNSYGRKMIARQFENCAEFEAVRKALEAGCRLEDLVMVACRTEDLAIVKACYDCGAYKRFGIKIPHGVETIFKEPK